MEPKISPELLKAIEGAFVHEGRVYLPKGTAPDVAADATANEEELKTLLPNKEEPDAAVRRSERASDVHTEERQTKARAKA